MNTLAPRLDVLPPAQRRLWAEFLGTVPASFVLYGGTALALRTGSRESEDFDFFSNDPLDAHSLSAGLPFLAHAELIQTAPSTATYLVDRSELKALSYFEDGDLASLADSVKETLSAAAAAVRRPARVALLSDRLDQASA